MFEGIVGLCALPRRKLWRELVCDPCALPNADGVLTMMAKTVTHAPGLEEIESGVGSIPKRTWSVDAPR